MAIDNSAGSVTPNADSTGETPNASVTGETPGTIEAALKELESYKKALAKANAESKDHRLKANELDKLKADLEASKLSETEKLQKQIADLQKAHDAVLAREQTLKVSASVSSQAAKLGFADPDDAIRFLDASEIDANASNVESLLKDLLKSKPYLAGTQRASSGGATNPSRSQANANQGITEEYVKDLLSGKLGADAYEKLSPAQRQQVTDITSKGRYR